MDTTSQLLNEAGMSDRPGYYSGRAATTSDIRPGALAKIHKSIKLGISPAAADEFVKMIKDLPDLAATKFILSLNALERNGWVWDNSLTPDSANYPDSYGSALGTIFEAMGDRGNHLGETILIKQGFLISIGRPATYEAFRYSNKRTSDW